MLKWIVPTQSSRDLHTTSGQWRRNGGVPGSDEELVRWEVPPWEGRRRELCHAVSSYYHQRERPVLWSNLLRNITTVEQLVQHFINKIFAERRSNLSIFISLADMTRGWWDYSYQSLRHNLHLNCWPTPSSIIRQHSWILSREIIWSADGPPLISFIYLRCYS